MGTGYSPSRGLGSPPVRVSGWFKLKLRAHEAKRSPAKRESSGQEKKDEGARSEAESREAGGLRAQSSEQEKKDEGARSEAESREAGELRARKEVWGRTKRSEVPRSGRAQGSGLRAQGAKGNRTEQGYTLFNYFCQSQALYRNDVIRCCLPTVYESVL